MIQIEQSPQLLNVNGRAFQFVETLQPLMDNNGSPILFFPQERFLNKKNLPLHFFGRGAFCSFRIAKSKRLTGVYLLVVNDSIRYVGECENVCKRFNTGYGNISPRNCYLGGRTTNCKINRKLLDVVQSGGRVELYFLPTTDRKAVERELLSNHRPDWNGRQSPIQQSKFD